MKHLSIVRGLAASCLAVGLTLGAGSAQAAMMAPHTFALHGTGQFKVAMASAKVTQISKGDFTVSISATHLPSPSMLHVMPVRHVYVAWLVNGMAAHGSAMGMAHLALMLDKKTGTYSGHGTVMIGEVTGVLVTAEPNAMAHAPAMPEVTALASSMAKPAM